ncbi:hypothetical protein [Candidatus Bandiella numerosa]|uniref:hypothetical protein n=1 Tax=Candidatus Bandiella numerosa TaxID=2570586 RepID=UPI001F3EA907|nr:hypothetical protein [Candidatus Bandiella numerosa]
MNDFDLNNSEVCSTDDNFGLLTNYLYNLEESIFYQCALTEEVRNKEITRASMELDVGKQFAFYDLGFSKKEKEIISHITINRFSNELVFLSDLGDNELGDIINSNLNLSGSIAYRLAELVKNIVYSVINVEGVGDAEIVLRTRATYTDTVCDYWHIDKDRNLVLEEIAQENKKQKYLERVYLIPIIGEGTEYKEVEVAKREKFHQIAVETPFYYGHGSSNDCKEEDPITKLFSGDKEMVKKGYGSVHKVGKEGAIHKAPSQSNSGRMILIITPIKH